MSETASHFLYVIAAETTGPVKIGISNDPDKRLRQLQTGHVASLSLHHAEPIAAHKVKTMERLLHRDMAHRRVRGEWFGMTVDEARRQIAFTIMRYDDEIGEDGTLKMRRA